MSKKIDTNCKELNLIELKKSFKSDIEFNELNCEKIILEKEDLNIISRYKINEKNLKELEIYDNNEMLLMPKKISISTNGNEIINKIEKFSNVNYLYFVEIFDKVTWKRKYLIINNKIAIFEMPNRFINELYFDCDVKDFSYNKELKKLVLPIIKGVRINGLKILNNFILENFTKIYLKKNNEIIELKKIKYITDFYFYNGDTFEICYIDNRTRTKSIINYSFNPEDNYYHKNEEYQQEIEKKLEFIGGTPNDSNKIYSYTLYK